MIRIRDGSRNLIPMVLIFGFVKNAKIERKIEFVNCFT